MTLAWIIHLHDA